MTLAMTRASWDRASIAHAYHHAINIPTVRHPSSNIAGDARFAGTRVLPPHAKRGARSFELTWYGSVAWCEHLSQHFGRVYSHGHPKSTKIRTYLFDMGSASNIKVFVSFSNTPVRNKHVYQTI
ncbi:hypothetical protein E8E14_002737 [Neopestalotiopsis sp. 37M]|nr:hypothetical protein E8E14_002737 [Neopestalotiopsis sp. 37M]